MLIKYRIISGEDDTFVRDIEIHEDNTFLDLHLAIQAACNYVNSLLSTFYLSNKSWDKLDEIVQDRIDAESQSDALLMEETKLNYFAPKIGQRYIYIFDFFSVRFFFIEIVNIRKVERNDHLLEFPICTLSKSKAPEQIFIDMLDEGFDEDFDEDYIDDYDDDDYDDDVSFENIDDFDI